MPTNLKENTNKGFCIHIFIFKYLKTEPKRFTQWVKKQEFLLI